MDKKRLVILIVGSLSFLGAILEPEMRISEVAPISYKSTKSPFNGMPADPLDLGKNASFCRAFEDKNVTMEIHFDVYVAHQNGRYTNIFQTDDVNKGMRIEISSKGATGIVVRDASGSGGNSDFLAIEAKGLVPGNKWTRINVSIAKSRIQIGIDQEELVALDGSFEPSCERVLIGGGFDLTRTTIGQVRMEAIITTTKETLTFGLPMSVRGVARVLFTLMLLCLIVQHRKKWLGRNYPDHLK